MYFLSSPRLVFRTWSLQKDLPRAFLLWGDPRVTQKIDTRQQLNEAQVLQKLQLECSNQTQHGIQYWPFFLKHVEDTRREHEADFVGCCGLRPYETDSTQRIAEIGFHIRAEHWRKGYASEAAKAVIAHAFDVLGYDALFAGHHPENTASRALLEKLGFVYTHHEFYEPTGLEHPSYLLSHTVEGSYP